MSVGRQVGVRMAARALTHRDPISAAALLATLVGFVRQTLMSVSLAPVTTVVSVPRASAFLSVTATGQVAIVLLSFHLLCTQGINSL